MKTKRIFIIAALLGTVLAGCQKSEIIVPDKNSETGEIWTLKVQVSKAKALGVSGSEVYAYWKDNEKVAVYLDGAKLGSLVATAGSPSTRATLVGNISRPAGLAVNSSLTLLFPGRDDNEWTYVGQDGSAPSEDGTMATLFDYSTASLNVDAIDEGTHTITASVTNGFTNQQSVYRFGFKVGGAGSAIAVKSFIISSNQGKLVRDRVYTAGDWASNYGALTVSPTAATAGNLYWMSLRNENTSADDTYSFSVVGSDNALYEGTKTIPSANLGNDKFLSAQSIRVDKKSAAPAASGTVSKEFEVL